jgi:hypothetical protein
MRKRWPAVLVAGAVFAIGTVADVAHCQSAQAAPREPTNEPAALPPSAAYAAALAPFNAARAQPDDLTEADSLALSLGIVHASKDCLALAPKTVTYAAQPEELLAMARLCIFGAQFEPARVALVQYLALPLPPERELAYLLLVRAWLGLKAPGSAEPELRTLLTDYPYDAQIHFSIDSMIEAEEGLPGLNSNAQELCGKQTAATLPLLEAGKALSGRDGSATADRLYADALRCEVLGRMTGGVRDVKTMERLTAVVQSPAWQNTAELAPMQAALARTQMLGDATPLTALHGEMILPAGKTAAHTVPLVHGEVVLMPFTLWAPSAPNVVKTLALSAPLQTIYAVTSWHANSGGADAASPQLLAALEGWQKGLPPHVRLMVVPDMELQRLQIDAYPAGLVLRNGIVVSNSVLDSEGAERLMLLSLQPKQ